MMVPMLLEPRALMYVRTKVKPFALMVAISVATVEPE